MIAWDMGLRGWSQARLAREASTKRQRVTEATVSRLITGDGYVSPTLAARVAAALRPDDVQPLQRYALKLETDDSDPSLFVQQSAGGTFPQKVSA